MLMLALGTVLAFGAAFAIVHGFNVLRYRDTERAAQETLSGFPGITLGATTVGLIVVTDIALIVIGLIAAFPDVIVTALLGVLGYVSLSGLIELQPETWGLAVIVAGTVVGLLGR